MFKKLMDKLPWRRPVPSARAKAMMLGAGAGPSLGVGPDGKAHVAVEVVDDDREKKKS